MRDDETLADWIGEDANRRFLKVPKRDVPALMEWVLYITGCPDGDLIDETERVLTAIRMSEDAVSYGAFRNSALYHEARKRHRRIGHGEECIADTTYSKAVKRVNASTAPESPCECGGVPQPGDWESLRKLFITADWSATIKTLSDGAWMDLHRLYNSRTLRMAIFRPFREGEQTASFVYDPAREQWFAVSEERLITLAWQPPNRLLAAVAALSAAHVAPPPPYLHHLPARTVKVPGPGSASRVNLPPAPVLKGQAPMADLPVPMTALSKAEAASVKSLANASGQAFLDALLVWLSKTHPDPRVFLCEDLIGRTCSGLNYLPSWYGRLPSHLRPSPATRKRRSAILGAAMTAVGAGPVPPWPDAAEAAPTPPPAPKAKPVPAPPPTPRPAPPPPPIRKPKKQTGMRMETSRILAEMFPQEFAALQQELTEKQALLKIKEKHYKLFSEIRRGLMAGEKVEDIIAALPPELKES